MCFPLSRLEIGEDVMDMRERAALDRHITGNYGEDQFKGDDTMNATSRPWTRESIELLLCSDDLDAIDSFYQQVVRAVNEYDALKAEQANRRYLLDELLPEAKAVLELLKRAFPYEREFIAGSVQHKAIVARDAVLAKMEQP